MKHEISRAFLITITLLLWAAMGVLTCTLLSTITPPVSGWVLELTVMLGAVVMSMLVSTILIVSAITAVMTMIGVGYEDYEMGAIVIK